MASSGTTQRSAPAASAAARAPRICSTLPARSPTTVLSCAAARRRCGMGPDYRDPPRGPVAATARRRAGGSHGPPEKRGSGGMRSLCGAKPAGLRAPDRRGAGHPLRPVVVHRRARDPQGVQHHLGRARQRARRGDDLRRLGHRRVQPRPGGRRPGPTRPQDVPAAAVSLDDAQVARVFCDIANLDGTPFEGDPRHALRRMLERARAAGYTFFASPEVEFFYFADADPARGPVTLDSGSYFDLTVADLTSDLRRRSVLMLEEMGIPVEHTQHEDAHSQHEIDLRYTDALTMADTVMTTRMVIKEMARQEGVFASL